MTLCTHTWRIRQFGVFGVVILILGSATETGCIRRHPAGQPSFAAALLAGQTSTKPSSDSVVKRLDEQAQRLWERLDKQGTVSPG